MWLFKRIIYLCIILAAILIAYNRKKSLPANLSALKTLLVIVFFNETLAIIFAYTFKQTSLLYALFGPVQVFLISFVYKKTFVSRKTIIATNLLMYACLIVMLVTAIINKAWMQVNSEGNTLKSIYIVLLCLLLFTDWLRFPTTFNIMKEPMFWVNMGFFFFFAINVFFWIGYDFLAEENSAILKKLEPIQYFSNLFLYGNILYAFILQKKEVKRLEYETGPV
ncbi:MAG: hypothetical protein ABJA78_05000 [Ferruginibacter sp.]